MRRRWTDLYNIMATYESDVIDIASDFDYYIPTINTIYNSNSGSVNVDLRTSFDGGLSWSEWHDINYVRTVLDNNENVMKDGKLQYRITLMVDTIQQGNAISPTFELFDISLVGAFKLINFGDVVCKPELWIKKVNGSGDIKLRNETNGLTLEFKDLNDSETVFVDCENEDIMTDLPLKYRYGSHNDVFIELDVGENLLTGEGDFELDIRMQFKTLQG